LSSFGIDRFPGEYQPLIVSLHFLAASVEVLAEECLVRLARFFQHGDHRGVVFERSPLQQEDALEFAGGDRVGPHADIANDLYVAGSNVHHCGDDESYGDQQTDKCPSDHSPMHAVSFKKWF
jgi:hypothetical protein